MVNADSLFWGCVCIVIACKTKWRWFVLSCVVMACAVGGCALVDPVDSRYDTIGRSLAKARNEAIFLNLVRASHDYPLSFTAISNVTPSLTNTSSLGLPNFLLGPGIGLFPGNVSATNVPRNFTPGRDVIFNNTTASDTTAVSTNFNVATQETGAFYDGFLRPVDLTTLDYFIRQGYSRELLFWLFADSVEVDVPGRPPIGTRYDPPNDYGCPRFDPKRRCFAQFVLMAIGAGLTVEEKTVQKPASEKKGGSDSGGGKTETTIYTRFCFDPVLAQQAQAQMGAAKWQEIEKRYLDLPVKAFGPPCGGTWNPQLETTNVQPDYSPFQVGPILFKIKGRSAYGVFEFLGTLMKLQRDRTGPADGVYVPQERFDAETGAPFLYTVAADRNIVTIVRDGNVQCFVHTWFYDGDYCVPEDAPTTKRIFSLLAQLIAIQTATQDLTITPIVRVIQ
jgi:hypothetical protein